MNRKFPMDQQTCRVELSSFAYTADEVGNKTKIFHTFVLLCGYR